METSLISIVLVFLSAFIGAFGPIYLKRGSEKVKNIKSFIFNKNLITGISFYIVSSIFFIAALKGGELSILYPLGSTVYVWVSFFSIKMLNEKMCKWKWLGICLIVIGVSIIGAFS